MPDADMSAPPPTTTPRTCRYPDPSLRLCLELDDGALSPKLHDGSTNQLDATATGLTQVMRAATDPAAQASSAVVAIPEASALDIADAITIEMWIKPDAYQASVLLRNQDQYAIGLSSGGHVYCAMAERQVFSEPLGVGRWSHIACTHDGTALRVYVNGEVERGASAPAKIATVGMGGTQIVPTFVGSFDAIRIYAANLGPQLCAHTGRSECD